MSDDKKRASEAFPTEDEIGRARSFFRDYSLPWGDMEIKGLAKIFAHIRQTEQCRPNYACDENRTNEALPARIVMSLRALRNRAMSVKVNKSVLGDMPLFDDVILTLDDVLREHRSETPLPPSAATLKRKQLEEEIHKSQATPAEKSDMIHTLSKLWMFATEKSA